MSRKTIELPFKRENLSILDEVGNLDKDLEPDLNEELLVDLHRVMLLGLRFEVRMLRLQSQGIIGTFVSLRGHAPAQIPGRPGGRHPR